MFQLEADVSIQFEAYVGGLIGGSSNARYGGS